MILLDAYAVVAFLGGEPALPQVRELLKRGDACVTSVNLTEALDVTDRVHGIPIAETRGVLSALEPHLSVLPVTEREAWRAADLRARHYHRSRLAVSVADCVLVATARADDEIATADRGVLQVARSENISVVPLLDSRGRQPE
ncbi:MAG TPA: PIN domain-containing protein [Gaiella sp.]|nr:PIN domain-containing protein [Gaiella sp.]